MELSAVRAGLATAAQAVVSDPPLMCLPYTPDSITPPVLYVRVEPFDYDLTMRRGVDEFNFALILLVSRADDRASQELLDAYVSGSGPASVKAAVEAERAALGRVTLGGSCDDAHVKRVAAYQWFLFSDVQYLGAQFTVRVIGPGGS